MQLASQGTRFASRKLASHANPSIAPASRAIHIPAFPRPSPRTPAPSQVQKLITQSRTLLTRFVAHLTTPGTIRAPSVPTVGRSLHSTARTQGIQHGLSFPVRTALGRPLQTPFMPRAPAVPRSMTQVGLGTARNFSSARPLFQNLAQNVPIAGRAFLEADWEIKMREEREAMRKPLRLKEKAAKKTKEMMKPSVSQLQHVILAQEPAQTTKASGYDAEIEHYFPTPRVAEVTTYLLIPLAPTPTARVPLPEHPTSSPHPSLLPLPELASLHSAHSTHTLRVSALFARLDTARVWDRGVSCAAYSHGPGADGVCTVLRVVFAGWTKAEVRGVIGESGSGWCVLEEVASHPPDGACCGECDFDDEASEMSDMLSEMSSEIEDRDFGVDPFYARPNAAVNEPMDPSQSFVLPTLDFSSSFLNASPSPVPPSVLTPDRRPLQPLSQSSSSTSLTLDSLSDSGSESSGGSWLDPVSASSTRSHTSSGWVSFSSRFARRVDGFQENELERPF